MSDNLRHWSILCKTDPEHTKPFQRAGGFRGTAIKPIWSTRQMTEHFGPCGIGWGMGKPEFTTMPVGDEILVFCTVELWYADGEGRGTVYGVGGDKVAAKAKEGVRASDEAFKASYTDALSNAMKQIGIGADVHMGLFEDHKYLREVAQEFAGKAAAEHRQPAPAPAPAQSPAPAAKPAPAAPQATPPKRDDAFYKMRSYEIDPKAVGGTLQKWEPCYRAAIAGCKTLDELVKVEEDNRFHFARFCEKASAAVVEDIRQLVLATEGRLKVGFAA